MEVLQALYELADRAIPADKIQLMLAGEGESLTAGEDGAVVLHTRRADLRARTPNQSLYLEAMATHDITFGIGPAGTGKTYLAVAIAPLALWALKAAVDNPLSVDLSSENTSKLIRLCFSTAH